MSAFAKYRDTFARQQMQVLKRTVHFIDRLKSHTGLEHAHVIHMLNRLFTTGIYDGAYINEYMFPGMEYEGTYPSTSVIMQSFSPLEIHSIINDAVLHRHVVPDDWFMQLLQLKLAIPAIHNNNTSPSLNWNQGTHCF